MTDHPLQVASGSQPFWKLGNFWLFLCLSSIFLVYPYFTSVKSPKYLLDLIFSGSIIVAVFSNNSLQIWLRWFYVAIGAVAVLFTWVAVFYPNAGLVSASMHIAFFGTSFLIYSRKLLTEQDVDVDTVLGVCCAYIILGLVFAAIFGVITFLDPKAIVIPDHFEEQKNFHLVYFSFVTLTTLGYGDVLPNSPATVMLAAYEAIIGQIYLTVVVAFIVGAHISNRVGNGK